MPNKVPNQKFLLGDSRNGVSSKKKIDDEKNGLSLTFIATESHETILAKAMKSLSFQERQTAINDLHGVSELEEDDGVLIEEKLEEMEGELSKISQKDAYLIALESFPDYVYDKDFRLLFLRSEFFNAKGAALRFVKHFEMKLRLFGREKLGKDILYSDLDGSSQNFAISGPRWLRHRDRSGRALCFWTPPKHRHEGPIEDQFSAMFWGCMNALRDKETQSKGMLLILYNIGGIGLLDPKVCAKLPEIISSIPYRFVGFHICYDNPVVHPLISLILAAFDKFLTVRCRSHYGSAQECIYSLMTFGIPREALPITQDGKVQNGDVIERFSRRLEQEKMPPTKELVVFLPGPFDVLLGRRKLCQDHVGNLRYRHFILARQDRYERANKIEKTSIAEEVVEEVKANSGHFLMDYYADFIEVSDIAARKKVAHAFRSQRRIQCRKRTATHGPKPMQVEAVSVSRSSRLSDIDFLSTHAGMKREFDTFFDFRY